MPRPKSDLTTPTQIQVAARVTASMKAEFKRLGGANWLRKFLADSLEKRHVQKQKTP